MRSLSSIIIFLLAVVSIVVACSNPIDRESDSDSNLEQSTTDPDASRTAVPVMDIVTPTPGSGEQSPESTVEPVSPLETPDVHVVQEGDTLYGISSKYGIELAQLVSSNGLADPNDIFVGQELILPKPGQ